MVRERILNAIYIYIYIYIYLNQIDVFENRELLKILSHGYKAQYNSIIYIN